MIGLTELCQAFIYVTIVTFLYVDKSIVNDKITQHCLRESWACNLADNEVPAHTLMKMGGWSSIETVQQFYLKSSDANEKKAVRVLEELMREGKSF